MVIRGFSQSHKQFIARRSILLVVMVLAVCLWQRTGLGTNCPINADSTASGFALSGKADIQQNQPEHTDTECELSNHLIQAQSQLIDFGLLLAPILLLILAWPRAGISITFPFLTEPIIPRQRHHLKLCVFQE